MGGDAAVTLPLDTGPRVGEVRAVAREHLVPLAAQAVPYRVDRPLLRALAAHGLLGRLFPAALGGAGTGDLRAVDLCVLREGLASECTPAETALALQGLGAHPLLTSAAPDVAARYVPPVARGEAVAAFALTEPEAGSDPAALALHAERDGDGWRLSGTKTWISNAPEADVYTVFARTTQRAGARGITAFAVPGDAAGLTGEHLRLLAPHAMGRLEFDGARVPGDHVLGEVDHGLRVALRTLTVFRPSVGAFAVGMCQAALDAATAHAASRRTFGKALREHQAVAHALADAATRTQAARLLVYQAAAAVDAGATGAATQSAMAKLFATETAQRVVDTALQVHGAAGLEQGHPLEHLYREVRAPRIYEGTSEIQREIIARSLFDDAPRAAGSAGGTPTRPGTTPTDASTTGATPTTGGTPADPGRRGPRPGREEPMP